MTLVLANVGETITLEAMVAKTAGQNLVLRLYKNNYIPVEASTAANFTEADFTGYSPVTLTAANWNTVAGDPSTLDYAKQSFTSSVGGQSQEVYGYYLTQVTSGKLVWAERFTSAPYTIVNNGDVIEVTLNISMS